LGLSSHIRGSVHLARQLETLQRGRRACDEDRPVPPVAASSGAIEVGSAAMGLVSSALLPPERPPERLLSRRKRIPPNPAVRKEPGRRHFRKVRHHHRPRWPKRGQSLRLPDLCAGGVGIRPILHKGREARRRRPRRALLAAGGGPPTPLRATTCRRDGLTFIRRGARQGMGVSKVSDGSLVGD